MTDRIPAYNYTFYLTKSCFYFYLISKNFENENE